MNSWFCFSFNENKNKAGAIKKGYKIFIDIFFMFCLKEFLCLKYLLIVIIYCSFWKILYSWTHKEWGDKSSFFISYNDSSPASSLSLSSRTWMFHKYHYNVPLIHPPQSKDWPLRYENDNRSCLQLRSMLHLPRDIRLIHVMQ